jgi:hypothetical protein
MMYRLYGMAAAMVMVLGLSAYSAATRAMNYKPAKASVSYIDRTCDFVETTEKEGVKTARGLTDSCDSTGEWDKVRDAVREKRKKKISGTETVHLAYTAPQDGSSRTAELKFTGSDDEFYELQAGSEVNILVSNSDPSKITKA